MRDWPGLHGPLVHVPDPVAPSRLVDALAAHFAPRYRVLSVAPRVGVPYQVWAMDLLGLLRQFGFQRAALIGERLACLPLVLVATWFPEHVWRIVLVDPTREPPVGDSLEARALRDCPPDWTALLGQVSCDVLEMRATDPTLLERVGAFLATPIP